jgi:hypothetical protein
MTHSYVRISDLQNVPRDGSKHATSSKYIHLVSKKENTRRIALI